MIFHNKAGITAALTLSMLLLSANISEGATARKRAAGGGGAGGGGLTTPNPTNPLEWNNRGVELGTRGIWDAAVSAHERALAGDPYNLTFRQNLSGAYQRYGKSLMDKNNNKLAIEKLHLALYVDGDNRSADDLLDTAIKRTGKDPTNSSVRQTMGENYDSDGNYPEAIAEYRHLVRMKDSGEAHFALGKVLVKQGSRVGARLVEGYAELRTAINKPWEPTEKNDLSQCHTQLANILKDLAFLARDSGRTQDALKRMSNAAIEFRRAVTLNPLNSDAIRGLVEVAREAVAINNSFDNHLMLGGAYQLLPDFEHAKREYEECYKIDRNRPELSVARRSFHLAVLSSTQATATMKALSMQKIEDQLRLTPSDAELLYIYGVGKEGLGDRDGAIRAYQAAVAINPNVHPLLQPRLQSLLGGGATSGAGKTGTTTAAGATGKTGTGATAATAGATGAAPGTPGTAAAPPTPATDPRVYAEGEGKLRSGDTEGAVTFFTALVDKTPSDGHAWMLLGRANEKKGDLDEATVDYRQAASFNESGASDAVRQINTSRIQPALKDYQEALGKSDLVKASSALKDAIQLAPNMADLHYKLEDVLKKMGDSEEAKREHDKGVRCEQADKAESKGGK